MAPLQAAAPQPSFDSLSHAVQNGTPDGVSAQYLERRDGAPGWRAADGIAVRKARPDWRRGEHAGVAHDGMDLIRGHGLKDI